MSSLTLIWNTLKIRFVLYQPQIKASVSSPSPEAEGSGPPRFCRARAYPVEADKRGVIYETTHLGMVGRPTRTGARINRKRYAHALKIACLALATRMGIEEASPSQL